MTATADYAQSAAEHRIAFVRLPRAIDVTNYCTVLDSLAAALAGSPSIVVANGDMTALCDCAGVSALVCAYREAAAAGAQLRLVAGSAHVRRIIQLTAADEVLDLYLTLDDALADLTGTSMAGTAGADPLLAGEAVEASGPDGQSGR